MTVKETEARWLHSHWNSLCFFLIMLLQFVGKDTLIALQMTKQCDIHAANTAHSKSVFYFHWWICCWIVKWQSRMVMMMMMLKMMIWSVLWNEVGWQLKTTFKIMLTLMILNLNITVVFKTNTVKKSLSLPFSSFTALLPRVTLPFQILKQLHNQPQRSKLWLSQQQLQQQYDNQHWKRLMHGQPLINQPQFFRVTNQHNKVK